MMVGQTLLVVENGREDNIKEWEVIKLSKTAVKVKNMVKGGSRSFFILSDNTEPFWVLLTDIDTIGKTKYQIIEELN